MHIHFRPTHTLREQRELRFAEGAEAPKSKVFSAPNGNKPAEEKKDAPEKSKLFSDPKSADGKKGNGESPKTNLFKKKDNQTAPSTTPVQSNLFPNVKEKENANKTQNIPKESALFPAVEKPEELIQKGKEVTETVVNEQKGKVRDTNKDLSTLHTKDAKATSPSDKQTDVADIPVDALEASGVSQKTKPVVKTDERTEDVPASASDELLENVDNDRIDQTTNDEVENMPHDEHTEQLIGSSKYGEIAGELRPLATATDDALDILQKYPSAKNKQDAVAAARAEKAFIENYIKQNQKAWDSDQDASNSRTMSLPKRSLLGRLAMIDEIERYNPDRRLSALRWRQEQLEKSLKNEVEYEATLVNLLNGSVDSRYPLRSGLEQFISNALDAVRETHAARTLAEKQKNNPAVAQISAERLRSCEAVEAGKIKQGYAFWHDSVFADTLRNRYAQLQSPLQEQLRNKELQAKVDPDYIRDLRRVVPDLTEEQQLADWLDFRDKVQKNKPGSTQERIRKYNKGRLLVSSLDEFTRGEFLAARAGGRLPTLTQYQFDKKYFNADLYYTPETLPTLKPSSLIALNNTIDDLAVDLQMQPPMQEVAENGTSETVSIIESKLNSLLEKRANGEDAAAVARVFLSEMKKMGPQRIAGVAGMSFSIRDDDGKYRWYDLRERQEGGRMMARYDIKNANPTVRYADPSRLTAEQRENAREKKIVFRDPVEEKVDTQYDEYVQSRANPLPESGDAYAPMAQSQDENNDQSYFDRDTYAQIDRSLQMSNRLLEDVQMLRAAESLNKQDMFRHAVEYFKTAMDFEKDYPDKRLPDRHQRQLVSVVHDMRRMIDNDDSFRVVGLSRNETEQIVERMEKDLRDIQREDAKKRDNIFKARGTVRDMVNEWNKNEKKANPIARRKEFIQLSDAERAKIRERVTKETGMKLSDTDIQNLFKNS